MASERIFLPLIRKTLPEIVDMHFPAAGIFHNIVLVSIDKRYPGHARKIMNAFWGLGQLMFSKTIIVVDKDVDVQNEAEVAWIVGTHYDPERDIQFTRGPVDDLEDASDLAAYGSKMGIDATRKWPSEGFTRPWPTAHRHVGPGGAEGRSRVGEGSKRMEMIAALGERVARGEAIDEHDARLILDCADLIAVGVAADTVRRRLHGSRTTFVRVFEVHVDAPPAALPPGVSAGEFRIVGRPASADAAVSAVRAAAAIAGGAPVTGFSIVDLQSLAPGTSLGAFCAAAPCRGARSHRRAAGRSVRRRRRRRRIRAARQGSCSRG